MTAGLRSKFSSLYFDYPHYPFVRPPEMDGQALRHQVAIVGGGPVGLACAMELARHGVSAVVIEDDDTVADGSRAVCIARRSMEILQGLGVAERFLEKGLVWTGGRSFYKDRVVYELEMPHSDDERFHPMTNLQQCYIEKFLIDATEDDGRIDIRWQSRVTGLEQDADGVTLKVETPEDDYDLRADYVVAADGARSAVRQLLDLQLNGTSYEGRYLIADIKMASSHPIERRAFFDPHSNPGSTVLMHKQPDDIWRIDYQLQDDDDPEEELREDRIRARIQAQLDLVGETTPWQLEWYSLYKAHCLALDDYRSGRVFFAGDAAHLVPIFGVRGLNSGFADANNLGWKLAYVLRGDAGDGLLDSYTPERREATLDIIREARKSTIFMTPPTRGYRLMRDAALSIALSEDFTKGLINPRQSAPYDYTDGPLTAFKDRESGFDAGPRAGAPLQNVRLSGFGDNRPRFLLDLLQAGFNGFYFHGGGDLPQAVKELFSADLFAPVVVAPHSMEVPGANVVADPDGHLAAVYGAAAGAFYLVRPDGHVAARWTEVVAAEVQQAVRIALGRHGEG